MEITIVPTDSLTPCANNARIHSEFHLFQADARDLPLTDGSIDLIVTSPPYWKKRDYGTVLQIGQEKTPAEYVASIMTALSEWKRVLKPTGSVFLNVGDTYDRKSLAGIPGRIEVAATDAGWILRNRVIWAKENGMPDPVKNRLANRHEFILHLVSQHDYYYDLFGYSEEFGNGTNPGDVWRVNPGRSKSGHLAPFPTEIARRAITLASPKRVCSNCGAPRTRIVEPTYELDESRTQARRAMELAREAGLTNEHIDAIRATGVSDAGKALRIQTGTGKNSAKVKKLAGEAKIVLGGYFREFTFMKRRTAGWTNCSCDTTDQPGAVLDPFAGTGTTLTVASELGRSAYGADLVSYKQKATGNHGKV